jgi:hypothetical protein
MWSLHGVIHVAHHGSGVKQISRSNIGFLLNTLAIPPALTGLYRIYAANKQRGSSL